jgi:hypothetical protein
MRTVWGAVVLLLLVCYATVRTPGQAPSTSLETVERTYDAVEKLNDLNREYQQKSDAAKFLQLYSFVVNAPDRSKVITKLHAAFPYAKGDQDVRDILAADEKALEKNPHPQEEEQSLDSAGRLFLRERTSIRKIDGETVDLPSFTSVRRLSAKGDTFSVTADGVNAFDVPRNKLCTARQDVLAMAQQKQQEAAQLKALAEQFMTASVSAAAQDRRRQVDEQQRQQQQSRQPEVPQQTIDRQEEILFLLGKVHRPGTSVVLPPRKQQAELWKEYLRLQSSRGDLPEQARQQAKDELASIEQEERNEEIRGLRAQAQQAQAEAQQARSDADYARSQSRNQP